MAVGAGSDQVADDHLHNLAAGRQGCAISLLHGAFGQFGDESLVDAQVFSPSFFMRSPIRRKVLLSLVKTIS